MAKWFGSEKDEANLPESLKGKTPEQIAKELSDAAVEKANLQAKVDAAAASQAEVDALKTENQTVKARVAELEANAKPKANGEGNNEPKGPTSILVDENQAFAERLTPLYIEQLKQGARFTRSEALTALRADKFNRIALEKWVGEVDKLFYSMPIANQQNVQSYENCFNVILGRNARELAELQKKAETTFVEPGSSSTTNQEQKPADKLTEAEAKIAERMKISPEQYLKSRQGMTLIPG